eukprot:SAG31_NODE_544_length_14245_cov_68.376644_10_plen_63_part_00
MSVSWRDDDDYFIILHLHLMHSELYNQNKTPNNGYLGSRNDEERSEMRYAVRIAEFSESSDF